MLSTVGAAAGECRLPQPPYIDRRPVRHALCSMQTSAGVGRRCDCSAQTKSDGECGGEGEDSEAELRAQLSQSSARRPSRPTLVRLLRRRLPSSTSLSVSPVQLASATRPLHTTRSTLAATLCLHHPPLSSNTLVCIHRHTPAHTALLTQPLQSSAPLMCRTGRMCRCLPSLTGRGDILSLPSSPIDA
jgi:hypothetical protein